MTSRTLPLPDRHRASTRPARTDHRAIFDAEFEAFQDHWQPHDYDEASSRRSSRRPISTPTCGWSPGTGDEIAGVVQNWIWADENEQLGRAARLARADQRPPTVAPQRARPRDDRGVAASSARRRHDRRDARASMPRIRPGRSACTRAWASRSRSGWPPTCEPWSAEPRARTRAVASWSGRVGGSDHAFLPDRGQPDADEPVADARRSRRDSPTGRFGPTSSSP